MEAQIPVAFFFEGFDENGMLNPDYHTSEDSVEKLSMEKIRDISKIAYRHALSASHFDFGKAD